MSSSSTLNSTQLGYAKRIVATIKAMNLPADQGPRAADIALAVVRVESSFHMYANENNSKSMDLPHDAVGRDHASVGLFQQQVGGAMNSTANWGTTEQLMNVEYSTRKFVSALLRTNWLNMSNGDAAQRVQGSAFPDRYAEQDAWAVNLRKELWSSTSPAKPTPPKPIPPVKKTVHDIALEVIAGKWGDGSDRKNRLTSAGYNAAAVQAEVNRLVAKPAKKSVHDIALEVVAGKWGNGQDRRNRLTVAGYDPDVVQAEVNRLV